jgi:hypothetical protein
MTGYVRCLSLIGPHVFSFRTIRLTLLYLLKHPKEDPIKIFKINLINLGFWLEGLLMCNLQTILQNWQFSDCANT